MTHEAMLTIALKRIIKAVGKYPAKDIPEIVEAADLALLALVKARGEDFEIKDLFEKSENFKWMKK